MGMGRVGMPDPHDTVGRVACGGTPPCRGGAPETMRPSSIKTRDGPSRADLGTGLGRCDDTGTTASPSYRRAVVVAVVA